MDPAPARALWRRYEPYHAVVYFAPEGREQYSAAGLKGGWMGYFASRSAAMGPVPAEVVTATFYVFHPGMVARAIPDAWRLSSPVAGRRGSVVYAGSATLKSPSPPAGRSASARRIAADGA